MNATPNVSLHPFFSYFGSKYRLAKHYPKPMYGCIVEPFAGSAGYSLLYHDLEIVLYDSYDPVVETWRYLIGASKAEILSLPLLGKNNLPFDKDNSVDEYTDLEPGAKYLIGFWLTESQTRASRYPLSRSRGGNWTSAKRQLIADQVGQIKHWLVEKRTFTEIENRQAIWFIDPPYQTPGKRYRENDIDYSRLAEWCQTRRGQVIVCEQEGATWLPFSQPIKTTNGSNKKYAEAFYKKHAPLRAEDALTTSAKISDIKVAPRHRKDLGDIAGLAGSIAEIGLLHPIVVTPDYTLVAGQCRLEAFKYLGRDRIPVTIVNLDDIVRGEFAENAFRKDFTFSEMVAIKRALEPLERAAAKERQAKAGPKSGRGAKASGGGNLPPAVKGKSRDKVAAFTGISARSLAKAEEIVAAAEAEPEKFGKLVEDMDRTGRADGIYRRMKIRRQAEALRQEVPPLPDSAPYRVIVVDPPWAYGKRAEDPSHRAALPYPSMSIEEICELPISSIAHEDCILWLWTTNAHMFEAFKVAFTWGFQPKTILTWAKPTMGAGDWLRGQTEHCILAVRGKPIVQLTNQTTLLSAPKAEHSAKPREFYDMVEALCPASRYADVFSRYRHNEKWDCHGDEAPPNAGTAVDDGYDAEADFAGSINDCYAAVRERVANGGPGWTPQPLSATAGSSSALPPYLAE